MALNIKKEIDTFFKNNWTETPIQYEGADFKYPTDKSWISLSYAPYDRNIYAYNGETGRKRTYTTVIVRCFDVNPTFCFDLVNKIQAMFECQTIGTIKVGVGMGDGNGAIDNENGTFQLSANFDTINYE